MIALSFLGKGKYEPADYLNSESNRVHSTKYFVSYIQEFFKPEKIFVIMTDEAEQMHGSALAETVQYEKIKIPSGKNEKELWEIFERIAEKVPDDSELVIDVTHGFRSQPMIVLAAATFLKTVKNVKIKSVLYGAFEAKNEAGQTPVFDITPFLNIMDWSIAVGQFVKLGNAELLQTILEELHTTAHKQGQEIKPKQLKNYGAILRKITESFSLNRPAEILENASILADKTSHVKDDVKNLYYAKPLGMLLDKIESNFSPLSMKKNDLFTPSGFNAQCYMIKYYLETHQFVQAVTLSREVIVSKLCALDNLDPLKRDTREAKEKYLNSLEQINRITLNPDGKTVELVRLWSRIRDIRNDIDHSGMNRNPTPAKTLIENVNDYCSQVIEFVNAP